MSDISHHMGIDDVMKEVHRTGISLQDLNWNEKIAGSVAVKNETFEKNVFSRITFDAWSSHRDVPATWTHTCHLTEFDVFYFQVPWSEQASRAEFALCCQQGCGTWWDNNYHKNYSITKPTPEPSKEWPDEVDGAKSMNDQERISEMLETGTGSGTAAPILGKRAIIGERRNAKSDGDSGMEQCDRAAAVSEKLAVELPPKDESQVTTGEASASTACTTFSSNEDVPLMAVSETRNVDILGKSAQVVKGDENVSDTCTAPMSGTNVRALNVLGHSDENKKGAANASYNCASPMSEIPFQIQSQRTDISGPAAIVDTPAAEAELIDDFNVPDVGLSSDVGPSTSSSESEHQKSKKRRGIFKLLLYILKFNRKSV